MATPSPEILDGRGEEQRNVRNLIRWVAGFVAWPALSGAIAMALFDFQEHVVHSTATLIIGGAALVVFVRAQRLAEHFVPTGPA